MAAAVGRAHVFLQAFLEGAPDGHRFADALDITRNHRITQAGKFSVQFDGSTLAIGEHFTEEDPDRFGCTLQFGFGGFFGATNKFPSCFVKIDVRR